jgi:hypothetical protein
VFQRVALRAVGTSAACDAFRGAAQPEPAFGLWLDQSVATMPQFRRRDSVKDYLRAELLAYGNAIKEQVVT